MGDCQPSEAPLKAQLQLMFKLVQFNWSYSTESLYACAMMPVNLMLSVGLLEL